MLSSNLRLRSLRSAATPADGGKDLQRSMDGTRTRKRMGPGGLPGLQMRSNPAPITGFQGLGLPRNQLRSNSGAFGEVYAVESAVRYCSQSLGQRRAVGTTGLASASICLSRCEPNSHSVVRGIGRLRTRHRQWFWNASFWALASRIPPRRGCRKAWRQRELQSRPRSSVTGTQWRIWAICSSRVVG